MNAYAVKLVDEAGQLHRYTQLARSCAEAESLAFDRFGLLRLLYVCPAASRQALGAAS